LESNYLRHFAIGGFERVGLVADAKRRAQVLAKGWAIKKMLSQIKANTTGEE
jgi:galactokinase/mevalonate kinase-like predicted kinase